MKTALIIASLLLAAAPSFAVVHDLAACVVPNSDPVMWGYSLSDGVCSSPGPRLTVPPGDSTLIIRLTNNLPVGNPTSIVIPGLQTELSPQTFLDSAGRQRVKAFVAETAPGGTQDYIFTAKPGTYLYHSGSHVQVQVQMGLYGAVTKDSAAGLAYPAVGYDSEALLFYSEVDPALHEAVAGGNYGPAKQVTSTFHYRPRYFLVNGQSGPATPINSFAPNSRVLIRFLNASLDAHVPQISNGYFRLVAEDGNVYPYAKTQYEVRLPPLKTIDAIWEPPASGEYVMWDRGLGMTTNGALGGGMVVKLNVAASTLSAVNDSYSIAEDSAPYAVAQPGVLVNDLGGATSATLLGNVGSGILVFNSNGSFTYTPAANFTGAAVFTYKAGAGAVFSNTATVTINVTPVNDAPVAANDTASANSGVAKQILVLANDTDVDGDALTVSSLSEVSPAGAGTVSGNTTTSVTFTPAANFTGTATFTYRARDAALTSNQATVTVAVSPKPNIPPVAVDDFATTKKNIKVTINVIANDSDPDGTIAANTVTINGTPQGGTVKVNNNGTVQFTPQKNFVGSASFTYKVKDNQGALSNLATVRINVVN